MSSASLSAMSGRARSCTGCRQVKLACDARKTSPQPCSRCRNRGLQCKFDNNFKRIPMRRVAQEITNGLHKLLPTTAPPTQATSPTRDSPAIESLGTPGLTFAASTQASSGLVDVPTPAQLLYRRSRQWLRVAQNDYAIKYQLGNVELDAETTIALLQHFERYFHPHAPFLANVDSVCELAMKSHLLFWTIILVSTREHNDFEGLYEQISVAHGVLLSQLMYNAINSVEDIHALLLLCLWPVPKSRNAHDPSWNYIGLATNAAMQIGCHRPIPTDSIASTWKGIVDQTAAEVGAETAALTWIHCFQIGARLAAILGLPPPLAAISQLKSIQAATSEISSQLTAEQKAEAEIIRIACLSTSEVDCAEDFQTRHSLIQMFDTQFNAIRQIYDHVWTSVLDIQLLSSKLNLYGLLLLVGGRDSSEMAEQHINRQLILHRIRDSALMLISRMTQLSNTSVDSQNYPAGALSFYPKHYFTSLFSAAMYLFRFLASYRVAGQQDTSIVVNGLMDAHKIFQSFPGHRDAFRAAVNIQTLADVIRSSEGSDAYGLKELVFTNRLGASIMYDAVFRIHQHRNRDPRTGASPAISDWIPQDSDPRLRLPLTPEQIALSSHATSSNHGTDDGHSQVHGQVMGPWTPWDSYMENFEVNNFDQWGNDLLSQMDPVTQAQMFEAATVVTMPVFGHQQYPEQ